MSWYGGHCRYEAWMVDRATNDDDVPDIDHLDGCPAIDDEGGCTCLAPPLTEEES